MSPDTPEHQHRHHVSHADDSCVELPARVVRSGRRTTGTARRTAAFLAAVLAAATTGCASKPPKPSLPPLALVSHVDLPRYMGDWYVIAAIPTPFDSGVRNARDSYRLKADGTVATTFHCILRGARLPAEPMVSRGVVRDSGRNAVWSQQYILGVDADYRIAWLADDYSSVVVGREQRDYVWIMSRTPTMAPARYTELVAFVQAQGYDVAKLERVPQDTTP